MCSAFTRTASATARAGWRACKRRHGLQSWGGMDMRRLVGSCVVGLLLAGTNLSAARSDVADAAMAGDTAAVRTLLAQHAEVNAAQADGATALHWAAYRQDLETASLLIRAGANVNAANRDGFTPLALACINGHA